MKDSELFLNRGNSTPKHLVKFVTANPGLGKTHAIVKRLAKVILSEFPTDYVVYVAPSILLCEEIADNIREEIGDKMSMEEIEKRLHIFHNRSVGRQSKVGLAITDLVASENFVLGSVLIITHPTFYTFDEKIYPLHLKKQTTVYFDEVHKSITTNKKPIKLGSKGKDAISSLFISESLKDSPSFKKLSISVVKNDDTTNLKKATNAMEVRRYTPDIAALIKDVKNPNIEVYTYSVQKSNRVHFYKVIVPAKVFVGFKETFITSAFFYDSQMYHLLRQDPDTKIRDVTKDFIPNYEQKSIGAVKRYSKVTIIPLTLEETPLSENHLDWDMLVSKDTADKLESYFIKTNITRDDFQEFIKSLKGQVNNASPKLKKLKAKLVETNRVEINPMKWYAKASTHILNELRKRGEKIIRPIVFVKKDKGYESFFNHDKWRVRVDEARGTNEHINSTLGAYIRPLIPPKSLEAFLKARLGEKYQVADDWAIASCIQCLMRTAVRDMKSSANIYLIVSDMETAQKIRKKLYESIHIDTDWAYLLGEYESLNKRLRGVLSVANLNRREVRNKFKREQLRFDPNWKELNRLSSRRSYLKKKDDPTYEKDIKALTEQITRLQVIVNKQVKQITGQNNDIVKNL